MLRACPSRNDGVASGDVGEPLEAASTIPVSSTTCTAPTWLSVTNNDGSNSLGVSVRNGG